VAREGHSAALVNDTMYIFGGRTQEGVDLGDLAAFRITSRRWYMFQNMGHSPSARSGHSMTAFGKHIVVMAGEPSSSVSDRNELSMAYILDTSKIRYPPNEGAPPQQALNAPRKLSAGEKSNIPQGKTAPLAGRESIVPGPQLSRAPDAMGNAMGNAMGTAGSRLPRAAGLPPSGPPPLQGPPQPRMNGAIVQGAARARSRTPTRTDRAFGPPVDTGFSAPLDRENMSPTNRGSPITTDVSRKASDAVSQRIAKESMDTSRSGSAVSRNTSRSHRQQLSQDSVEQSTPRRSIDLPQQRSMSRDPADHRPIDSGVGTSPAIGQHNEDLLRDLELAKSRNAWYASELALARKAGYNPGVSTSPIFDERVTDGLRDEDKPLLEALFKMKSELERVQNSIKSQGEDAAKRIAEVERQRDAAINEAIYAKTKLAAHGGGSQSGTPQPDATRSAGTPDMDRIQDINRRLVASLAAQSELSTRLEKTKSELDAERKAKQLAEDTAEAAQNRVQELDSTRQKASAEFESLRADLHEAERVAREASARAAEAETSAKLLMVDKHEMGGKVSRLFEDSTRHTAVLGSLRDALAASSEKSAMLEKKHEDEKAQSDHLRQKLAELRAEHEVGIAELETATQKLRDAEELAEKHAEEARHHRQAVMVGLDRAVEPSHNNQDAMDERVVILQQQVETANAMARKNQAAADQASEKLRRAEERIAGLEAYQEQSSREGLTIRKQLQQAMREMQSSESEKADIHQRHERLRLDSNASEVQLKSLRNLLEERGVNPVDARRSRVLDSPSSRVGTPELNRVKELEQHIDSLNKSHEETRAVFEQREHDVSKDWEEKLQALHNDHQAAVKYLRGTEKMLAKMKQELDRYKTANSRLEEELEHARSETHSLSKGQNSEWEAERTSLRSELSQTQEKMKANITGLEKQLAMAQSELAAARQEAEAAEHTTRQAESLANQKHLDLESLRRQHAVVEERAREAENRVQMFLDQFETSVDTYRRQSQVPAGAVNGEHTRHRAHDSVASAESIYSHTDDSSTPDATRPASAATRNSMALDNLASELDALRSHWETTNKAYRLSDRFEFEKPATGDKNDLGEHLSQWRRQVDAEEQVDPSLGKEHVERPALVSKTGPAAAVAAGPSS
jgi:chromosome segregation ATPase